MIITGGPGKIFLPDGTEIGVTFEPFAVKFLPTGHTQVTWTMENTLPSGDIVSGRMYLASDKVEDVQL